MTFIFIDYLSDISEMLLYLLLPPEDFHNKPFRYFFRVSVCLSLQIIMFAVHSYMYKVLSPATFCSFNASLRIM